MQAITVSVPGVPQPQGSIRHLGKGRPSKHSNAKTLLPWRAAVAAAAQEAMRGLGAVGEEWPLTGPVHVDVVFYLPRPASAPRSRRLPHVRPDLDKLVRAVLDALGSRTGAGVFGDDGQVVTVSAAKQYGMPGCLVTVWPVADDAEVAS